MTKLLSIALHSILKCLSSILTKIYLAIAIVLRCRKKCWNFLLYFDGNSVVIICSLFLRQNICVFLSVVVFQLVKIANWFLILNVLLSGGLKIFYGSILVSSLN